VSSLVNSLSRLIRMGPREVAVRAAEKWWGWRERLSVLHRQGPAARSEFDGQSLLEKFRLRPFHALGPTEDRGTLVAAFDKFFPGRVDGICKNADLICRGCVSLFGQAVQFSSADQLDWHLDWKTGERLPVAFYRDVLAESGKKAVDIKRVWETNRQQFLVTLGRAFLLTGNRKYSQRALSLIRSWIDANPPYLGVNWREGLEGGVRLLSWLWTLRLVGGEVTLDREVVNKLLDSVALQRTHIERHLSTYSSPNTHLLGEALALFYVGLLLPEVPSGRAAAGRALQMLEEELIHQVAEDGSHREKSAYYHCYALEMYLLATILGRQHGLPFSPLWMKRVETMAEFLLYILRPDGSLARFGDDDGGKTLRLADEDYYQPRSLLAVAAVLFDRGDFKHMAGELPEEVFWLCGPEGAQRYLDLPGSPPENPSRWFPQAQLAILRSGWNQSDLWCACQQDPMGMETAGHSHASILSFELSLAGKSVLIDPGTSTYASAGPWRNHFRSLEAHNTLRLGEHVLYSMAGPFRWDNRNAVTPLPSPELTSQSVQLGYTAGKSSKGFRHVRTFRMESDRSLTVEDSLEGSGVKSVALWLHFAPGCRVNQESDNEFSIRLDGIAVRLALNGFRHPQYRRWEGSEAPVAGWFSARFDSRIPATVLCIEDASVTFPTKLAMRFEVVSPQAELEETK
jgi:hypothetical protein